MTELTGKAAVITGASRGIGQAVAIRLGRLGANAVVNYSRDASGAAATVAAIEAAGSRAIDVRADVSKPDEIEALLDTARSRFGGPLAPADPGVLPGLRDPGRQRMFGPTALSVTEDRRNVLGVVLR
ncbi:SDR family NAD(P)-dependent oxidoreductase [Streptomyces sp. NPDC020951]|uniref:SDR family NAD(P)-dependent oxidoreductase n=1 Tax=Streptomyces sp. NPDC020951 TaxID=3365104 RepID=UPI0037954C89